MTKSLIGEWTTFSIPYRGWRWLSPHWTLSPTIYNDNLFFFPSFARLSPNWVRSCIYVECWIFITGLVSLPVCAESSCLPHKLWFTAFIIPEPGWAPGGGKTRSSSLNVVLNVLLTLGVLGLLWSTWQVLVLFGGSDEWWNSFFLFS